MCVVHSFLLLTFTDTRIGTSNVAGSDVFMTSLNDCISMTSRLLMFGNTNDDGISVIRV